MITASCLLHLGESTPDFTKVITSHHDRSATLPARVCLSLHVVMKVNGPALTTMAFFPVWRTCGVSIAPL